MRGPRAIPDSEFRWESIQQVAKEIGLKLDPALVIRIDAAAWSMKAGLHPMAPEIGYKPMQALLEKTRDFTAVFCFNDIAAIGAIRALKDAGLSVPGDVSVVGFDDILLGAASRRKGAARYERQRARPARGAFAPILRSDLGAGLDKAD